MKNLDVGGFAAIPVLDPTKAGGFVGIHFYAFRQGSRASAGNETPQIFPPHP
ncbi:MAG: hypothetical protein J4F48_05170 [Nitrospinae bacterium]|nr:hypothetical protein [Nitrospinota bacterium]